MLNLSSKIIRSFQAPGAILKGQVQVGTLIDSSRCLISYNGSQKVQYRNHSTAKQFTGSLIDSFGRRHNYLRISLTEKCNLRCIYCMPEEGVQLTPSEKLLSSAEIGRLAEMFVKKMGVTKIRLTGGEPTIRKDILDILEHLNSLRQFGLKHIAMTTNGIVFGRHCQAMKDRGLDSVNISLDTLDPLKYQMITRKNGFNAVMKSIDAALKVGIEQVKINCVPMKDMNEDELEKFVEFTRDKDLEIRFIEYMPFDGNKWQMDKMVAFQKLVERIREQYPLKRLPPMSLNETSRVFQVDGFKGRIGFIASMSEPFCSGCNRLRITADGNLKVCLFEQRELSLRDIIRTGADDKQIFEAVKGELSKKKKQHAGALNISKANKNRPMILIANQTQSYMSLRQKSDLTHIDSETNRATMVSVQSKQPTKRIAVASAVVNVGGKIIERIQQNTMAKGDVLMVSKIAAIMGAKQTHNLIPLCHQIALEHIDVEYRIDGTRIFIQATATATDKTGVEMEAMMAASLASLTIYDMCKAMNKSIVIEDIHLVSKSGGKSGDYHYKK